MRNKLLNQKTYAIFDGAGGSTSLPGLCLELLSEQKKVWLDLLTGYESLKDVRERDVSCRGFSVCLQHNPARIKSSMADVSEKSSKERRCFLCLNHLPEEQKGILYRSDYLILSNPMPVFPSHFTISHLDHRRQAIIEHIETLLQLMADFGSGWTVLYNGPRCGASAPDHLHFQAFPSGQMPIEKEIQAEKRLTLMEPHGQSPWSPVRRPRGATSRPCDGASPDGQRPRSPSAGITQGDGVLLYRVKGLGREVILLEGDDPMAVGAAFNGFLNALKKVLAINEEPMMNIAGFYIDRKREERTWRLLIFPRQKHRPDAFFKEGDSRVVVSPGVIDMAGVLITPVEKDFDRLDTTAVEGIYREVSLNGKTVERAIQKTGR